MGRPAIIVKERVAEVTLRLIDEEGLDAVSIERIASELGVRGPSLYHHFADKAAILVEVARLVLGDLDLDRDTQDWQQWMVDASLLLYERVVEHPRAAVVLLQYLPNESMIPGLDRAASLMSDAGVDQAVQLLIMEGMEKMIWGWAMQHALAATHADRLAPSLLGRRWPHLSTAVRNNRWDHAALVEISLRAFLSGVLAGDLAAPRKPANGRVRRSRAQATPVG